MSAENVKTIFDGVSVAGVIGTLAGWLPAIAAAASLVWTLIRIYETRTVQKLLGRRSRRADDQDESGE